MQKIIVDICAIIMPTLLGYVVWLLKNQKKDRDANSKGTMMVKFYVMKIKDGVIKIEDVPDLWKAKVEEALKEE